MPSSARRNAAWATEREPEHALPAPKIAHDDAKFDVRLHVGYISPPKASIHSEHETIASINVVVQGVLTIPKLRVLMHADMIGAQIR